MGLACEKFGLYKSSRFDVTLYGEHGANVCAKAWADKMQFYYEL